MWTPHVNAGGCMNVSTVLSLSINTSAQMREYISTNCSHKILRYNTYAFLAISETGCLQHERAIPRRRVSSRY